MSKSARLSTTICRASRATSPRPSGRAGAPGCGTACPPRSWPRNRPAWPWPPGRSPAASWRKRRRAPGRWWRGARRPWPPRILARNSRPGSSFRAPRAPSPRGATTRRRRRRARADRARRQPHRAVLEEESPRSAAPSRPSPPREYAGAAAIDLLPRLPDQVRSAPFGRSRRPLPRRPDDQTCRCSRTSATAATSTPSTPSGPTGYGWSMAPVLEPWSTSWGGQVPRYNQRDLAAALVELADNVDGLMETWRLRGGGCGAEWDRRAARRPGEDRPLDGPAGGYRRAPTTRVTLAVADRLRRGDAVGPGPA